MKEYNIKPGQSDFRPIDSGICNPFTSEIQYEVVFDESCLYTTNDRENQEDWNKGGGITNDWFSNTRNAAMWAWRGHKRSRVIELTPYWHVRGEDFYPNSKAALAAGLVWEPIWILLPLGVTKTDPITITMKWVPGGGWGIRIRYQDQNLYKIAGCGRRPWRWIGLWYGGNEKANQAMKAWMSRNSSF